MVARTQPHAIVAGAQCPNRSPPHRLNTYRHRNASITNPNAGETCRRPA
jgi:hypothetical protein